MAKFFTSAAFLVILLGGHAVSFAGKADSGGGGFPAQKCSGHDGSCEGFVSAGEIDQSAEFFLDTRYRTAEPNPAKKELREDN